MTHTPGPWSAREKFRAVFAEWSEAHHVFERQVAYLPPYGYRPFSSYSNDPEMIANARLIAAAPKMLKGLERAEQTIRNIAAQLPEGDLQQIARNEAANLRDDIAKAEGGE